MKRWWRRIFFHDRRESDAVVRQARLAVEKLDEALKRMADPDRRPDHG